MLLVRILFCLFAEARPFFEKNIFRVFREEHTRSDGSNVGSGGQLTQ